MLKYITRRLLALIPIMLVISMMVFFFMSLTGDPALTIASDQMTAEEIEILRENMGLNDPFIVRYGRYMNGVLHGDFGKDLRGQDVWMLFSSRLPYTIVLSVAALFVIIVVAIPCGIIAAIKQNTWTDTAVSTIAIAGMSIPNFWIGLMLMLLFGVKLGWLPTSGATSISSIVLPAISAAMVFAAASARTTRSSMLDCLRADYLRTARAKGVSEKTVITKHALKNALSPIVTVLGSQFCNLLGGTVIVESVFSWPGIGNLIVSGVRGNEFTLVTSCIIMTTLLIGICLIAIDVLYAYIDPRIKAIYTGK